MSGGYPDAQQQYSQMYRKIWFSNYMSALMDRDIHDLANIDHPVGLHYLLLMLSARSGTLFNQSDVSRACAIPNSTAIRYMTMLEDLHLVWRLPAWSGDLGRRVIKMPKVHVADSGLACHLCGADEERLTGDPAQMARLLETFVANELRKQATWTGHPVSLFHFSHRGGEVDMVLEDTAGRVVGVDVKLSGTVVDRDARGLAVLRDALGDRFVRGVILYGGQQTLPFGDRLLAAPFGTLLPPARPGTEVTPSGAA
ncbi:MAG: DUF4143 domain-containing protein [Desulfovibrio sp.]|nr:DUF4143 domain-containing protein [Desulfovibrio sp.]